MDLVRAIFEIFLESGVKERNKAVSLNLLDLILYGVIIIFVLFLFIRVFIPKLKKHVFLKPIYGFYLYFILSFFILILFIIKFFS